MEPLPPTDWATVAFGARGWIRTSTVHRLEVTPPADWATRANGGWCTIRTCAPLRARHLSKVVPYLSANHPENGGSGGSRTPKALRHARFSGPAHSPMWFALPWELSRFGAPRWIRTSNLRLLRAAPLPVGLQGLGDRDGRARIAHARRRWLRPNSVSADLVGRGSRIGPWRGI
jgi:hypothetical protein